MRPFFSSTSHSILGSTNPPPPPPPFQKRTTLLIAFPFPFLPSFLHFLGTPQPQPLSYYTLYFPALRRFSITNLLLAYSLPFLYLFFPALILPAIFFFRSLSFIVADQRIGASNLGGGGLSAWKRGRNGRDFDEDDALDGNGQDMEYWLQRCSICFDAQLDLCLDYCRDQFCRECFQRYITEVVHSSWGLSVTKIRCPVCQDVIPQSEWARYVPTSVVERYNTYNQPYRSFGRHCDGCGGEVTACDPGKVNENERERQFQEINESLNQLSRRLNSGTYLPIPLATTKALDSLLKCFETDYHAHITCVSDLYRNLIPGLLECIRQVEAEDNESDYTKRRRVDTVQRKRKDELSRMVDGVSAKLVALETRPEQWRELQFLHVKNFPMATCSNCAHELCLQCGDGVHHTGLTCFEHMQCRVEAAREPPEILENLRWKLLNSKSCPNCCVLINRDDGCNKVDCLHCGHRFCWICQSQWSEKCGFYQCRIIGGSALDDAGIGSMLAEGEFNTKEKSLDTKPEIGVPNVIMIQARIIPGFQR